MILPFFIVWLLSHTSHAPHWALETWTWICHHVLVTVLILILGL